MSPSPFADAAEISAAVRSGSVTARVVTLRNLAHIAQADGAIGAFTRTLHARALADADRVDRIVAAGGYPGPLAGVPVAAKDLFDVAGEVTTAGAASRRHAAPAIRDASAVERLRAAGAVLVGTTNMDKFAYGFSTENAHFGVTRNPHDTTRIAGGSSGGSAAAVAAGMACLAIGSDTNGSIRVPASLCGLYGLRPSMDAVPAAGMFPFVESLDSAGPFARSLDTLALAFEALAERRLTVLDGAPATLSWLGGVRGQRVSPLGTDRFGQTGDIPDLYRTYRIDAEAIIDALAELVLEK